MTLKKLKIISVGKMTSKKLKMTSIRKLKAPPAAIPTSYFL